MATKLCSKIIYRSNNTYKQCRYSNDLYVVDSEQFYIQSIDDSNVIDISETTTWLGANASKVEYCTTNDQTWKSLSGVTSITLNKSNKLYLKSSSGIGKTSLSDLPLINSTKKFKVGGSLKPIVPTVISYSLNNFFIGTKIDSFELKIKDSSIINHYGFYRMFKNCTSLTKAYFYKYNVLESLDSLGFIPGNYCFSEMFYGCTNLNSSIESIDSVFSNSLFIVDNNSGSHKCDSMYYGCTNMIIPPIYLISGGDRTISDYEYYRTFYNCKKLIGTSGYYINALNKKDTTLGNYSYAEMFYGCTSLTVEGLFEDISVGKIYLLSGGSYGYYGMFRGCTSLENANFIKSNDVPVESHACDSMFYGCTSLTSASVALPILNNSAGYQYASMFMNCTSLVNPPTLASQPNFTNYCCYRMFRGCTSMTTMTKISGRQIYSYGFREMFYGCSKLNYIWCYASPFTTNGLLPEASNGTTNWVYGVAASGDFYYADNRGTYSWADLSGSNTIPSGWRTHAVSG